MKNSDLEVADTCCASCGKAEVDEIKLMKCDGCDLVSYCSVNCQRDDISRHLIDCKKRAAELRDEILFRQPESTHLGDCPICCLPFPVQSTPGLFPCCSKRLCYGCHYANLERERRERRQSTCPFCRHIIPKTEEEIDKNRMKRVEANDPRALIQLGTKFDNEGDYERAFKYYTKAAELGDVGGHHNLSIMYHYGQGVEKDEEKELYHMEEAAITGHPVARYNLARHEEENGRIDRMVKHLIIAANLGDNKSIHSLKECYKNGLISKDDFAAALRAHQAAVDATKSPQREAAEKAMVI